MTWTPAEVLNYGGIYPGDEAFIRVGKTRRRMRVLVEKLWLYQNGVQAWIRHRHACTGCPASELEPIGKADA